MVAAKTSKTKVKETRTPKKVKTPKSVPEKDKDWVDLGNGLFVRTNKGG